MKENNFSSRLSMFRQNKNMTQEVLQGVFCEIRQNEMSLFVEVHVGKGLTFLKI